MKSSNTFKQMLTDDLKIGTFLFQKPSEGKKRRKPAKKDEDNVKRKKAKVKGKRTFGVTECTMPST